MNYPCAKFGFFSFSRFGFIVQTDRQTDRQTESQTRMVSVNSAFSGYIAKLGHYDSTEDKAWVFL